MMMIKFYPIDQFIATELISPRQRQPFLSAQLVTLTVLLANLTRYATQFD